MSKIKTLLDLNVSVIRSIVTQVKKRPGFSLTVVYVALVFAFRGSDFFRLLRYGPSNELGDFLAGVFTPVALGWLIAGYFSQREELRAQREELELQRGELRRTGNALERQVKIEEKRIRDELRRFHRAGIS